MPSCLSGWPGKYNSSSVFYSTLPQISVKYSTLWAWFLNFFYPVTLQRELWIQCKKLNICCRAFIFFALPVCFIYSHEIYKCPIYFHTALISWWKNYSFSYIDFFLYTECWNIPFAKNLLKLLIFILWHIHATAILFYAVYTTHR